MNSEQITLITIYWLNMLLAHKMVSLNEAAAIWIADNAAQYRKEVTTR